MGKSIQAVAEQAAKLKNITKVYTIDNDGFKDLVAEKISDAVLPFLKANTSFTHIFAPTSNATKNYLPRIAALMDSAPLTDVMAVIDENTFKRPMYAGNAIATVTMSNPVKVYSGSSNCHHMSYVCFYLSLWNNATYCYR